jgi:ATP-dependent helicase HrpB
MRRLPLPPRLARMVMKAAEHGAAREAAEIAALLVERGLGGNDTSLEVRLDNFRRDRGRRASDMRRLADGWAASTRENPSRAKAGGDTGFTAAQLLALAYPDRIAKARGAPGQFLLANGRGAHLDATDALARSPFLAIAELQGKAAATRILLAAAASELDIAALAGDRIIEREELSFDAEAQAVRARRVRRLDAIELASEPLRVSAGPETEAALADGIARLGIAKLPWSKAQLQLRDRSGFLRAALGAEWPDLGDASLEASVRDWLLPFLAGKMRLADISADDLGQALDALIPWSLKRRLEDEAPTHFEAPTGNRHAIDYEGAGAPSLHIRVQELFGLKIHPAIAGGRLPLTLHLLSPAHRPVQITRDLPGFWAGSWAAVKADMKGRYPRHFWPDDPSNALPTARAKPRGT